VCDTLDPRTTEPGKKPIRTENKILLIHHKAARLLSMSQRSLDYLIAKPTLSVRHRIWSVDSGLRSSVVCPRRSPATYCRLNDGEYLPITFAKQDVFQVSRSRIAACAVSIDLVPPALRAFGRSRSIPSSHASSWSVPSPCARFFRQDFGLYEGRPRPARGE
jgi:hypothetical protein